MRVAFILILAVALTDSVWAALLSVPMPNEVVSYQRLQPIFESTRISKELGDTLLLALDGGRQIKERQIPPGVVCALPLPARHWLTATRTNGSTYRLGVSFEGGLVDLPEGLYQVTDSSREPVAKVVRQLDDDLRREIVNTPKPLVYQVGMINDGGTLGGISRLFYGDATKWRQIFEANRKIIKNPDVIDGRMRLTIPRLE